MASNLDPKTAGFSKTSMLLGSEEYPSTIQNAEVNNTGYLLYGPKTLVIDTTEWRKDESSGTLNGWTVVAAGTYDIFAKVVADGTGINANWVLKIDGTTIVSGSTTGNIGTLAAFVNSTDRWITSQMIISAGISSNVTISSWSVLTRQYG